jgi:hypothetical protein
MVSMGLFELHVLYNVIWEEKVTIGKCSIYYSHGLVEGRHFIEETEENDEQISKRIVSRLTEI